MSIPDDEVSSFVLGAFLNIAGSVTINLGTTLLKYSHVQREKQQKHHQERLDRDFLSYKWWWRIAFSIFCAGNVLNFASFGFAAQSLLAGLGSVQFVSNVAFSYFILHAVVTPKILISTGVIVVGNVLLVTFGNHEDQDYPQRKLLQLYGEAPFLIYLGMVAVLSCTFQGLYVYLQRRSVTSTSAEVVFQPVYGETIVTTQPATTQNGASTPPADDPSMKDLPAQRKPRDLGQSMIPILFAAVSAMIGTFSVTFAKSISELLRITLNNPSQNNQFIYPFPYAILFGLAVVMTFWLYRLNRALFLFDAIYIVPVMQVQWIIFSVLGGGIYFQEFEDFDVLQFFMFFSGIVTVMLGVMGLAPDDTPKDGIMWRRPRESISSSNSELPAAAGATAPAATETTGLKSPRASFWANEDDIDLLLMTQKRDEAHSKPSSYSLRFHL